MNTRILIIEDNQENLELMVYLLGAFGYETASAITGEDGLKAARQQRPALIVCDIHLPGLSGYEVARRIKSEPGLRDIPLVAVTALAMVGDRDKVLAAGFNGYISKPIAPETFVQQIEAFLPAGWRPTPRPAAVSTPALSVPSPAKRATIMVVDDALTNRELIRSTLEPFGIEVALASSVAEALTALRRSLPDLILSDMHMREDDGLDFLRIVKADPQWSAIPFVFISSSDWTEEERARALKVGPTCFLSRPIEPQRLIDEVNKCLANARPV